MLTKYTSMIVLLIVLMACSDTSVIVPDSIPSKGTCDLLDDKFIEDVESMSGG